jgi:hypothetical protein
MAKRLPDALQPVNFGGSWQPAVGPKARNSKICGGELVRLWETWLHKNKWRTEGEQHTNNFQ